MHISRIAVRNFRNFRELDLALGEHAVIVGENAVGKSNLLCALGLVVDPGLPESARELRDEDFWDGYVAPRKDAVTVEVVVELSGIDIRTEGGRRARALVGEYAVSHDPLVARLTYTYRPKAGLSRAPVSPADYEFRVYGGTDERLTVDYSVRRGLGFEVFRALRDAERALANWRRSPMRPLLTDVLNDIPRERLAGYASGIDAAARDLTAAPEIGALAERITMRIARMAGQAHALRASLGLTPSDPESLFRSLQLFVDERLRDVSHASVGAANVIYLALASLGIERATTAGDRVHTILAIEEPEAHLHPHLQRLVYRDFLRTRRHLSAAAVVHRSNGASTAAAPGDLSSGQGPGENEALSTLLTTHSPHIVSVSPVRALAILRRQRIADVSPVAVPHAPGPDAESARANSWAPSAAPAVRPGAMATIARSTARAVLSDIEEADLERYLDVSRGELAFARGVVLVEGEAEQYLVPALAAHLGLDLEQLGVSVCSIGGTHFTPFLKLLGTTGLDIPAAVLTDWDPDDRTVADAGENSDAAADSEESSGNVTAGAVAPSASVRTQGRTPERDRPASYGARRLVRALTELGVSGVPDATDASAVRAAARGLGFFTNEHTLEVDLFRAGAGPLYRAVLAEQGAGSRTLARLDAWVAAPTSLDAAAFLVSVERFGKGRIAQSLARHLLALALVSPDAGLVPSYVKDALQHLVSLLPDAPSVLQP